MRAHRICAGTVLLALSGCVSLPLRADFDASLLLPIPNDAECNEDFVARLKSTLDRNRLAADLVEADTRALRSLWSSLRGKAVLVSGTTLFIGTKGDFESGDYVVIGRNGFQETLRGVRAAAAALNAVIEGREAQNETTVSVAYMGRYEHDRLVRLDLADGPTISFAGGPGDYTLYNGKYSAIYQGGALQKAYLRLTPRGSTQEIVLEYGRDRVLTEACLKNLLRGVFGVAPIRLPGAGIVGFTVVNSEGKLLRFNTNGYAISEPEPPGRAVESRRTSFEVSKRAIKIGNLKTQRPEADLFPGTAIDYPYYIPVEIEHRVVYHSLLVRAVDGKASTADTRSDAYGNVLSTETNGDVFRFGK